MADIARLLAMMTGLAIDPFLCLPVIIAGFSKRWWMPPAVGATAAILSDILVQAIDPMGYHGQVFVLRIITGVAAGFLVLGIRKVVKIARPRHPLE